MKAFLICFSILAVFSVSSMAYFAITDTQPKSTAFHDSLIKNSNAMSSLNNTISTEGKCK